MAPFPVEPMASQPRILWADDEIDLLKPHVLFLESRGYAVTCVTNGADAVDRVRNETFELVLLDEQMPGMGGLEAMEAITDISSDLPVVMITKSEEERLMEEALGRRITDYLTKPVNPSQVLLTCKRILERRQLEEQTASQDYLQSFGELSSRLGQSDLGHTEWVDVYRSLVRHDMEVAGDDGREFSVYGEILEWILEDAPVVDDDADSIVVFVASRSEVPIDVDVQVALVDEFADRASLRFVDQRAEALVDDEPEQPVRDSGILVGLGAIAPEGEVVEVYVDRYLSRTEAEAWVVTTESSGDAWQMSGEPAHTDVRPLPEDS